VISRFRYLDPAADVGHCLALGNQLLDGFEFADQLLGGTPGMFHGRVPGPTRPDEDLIHPGPISGVRVTHMQYVAGLGPLVSAHLNRWPQVFETLKAHSLEGLPHGGEWCRQQPGDASEGSALMAQLNGSLYFLWVDRPPLGAVPAASIHQGIDTT